MKTGIVRAKTGLVRAKCVCVYESRTRQTLRFVWVECVCLNESRIRSVTNCMRHERVRPSGPCELQNCMSHELLESRKCQTLRFVSKEPEAQKAPYGWNVRIHTYVCIYTCVYGSPTTVYMGHQLRNVRNVRRALMGWLWCVYIRVYMSHQLLESQRVRPSDLYPKSLRRKRRRMSHENVRVTNSMSQEYVGP